MTSVPDHSGKLLDQVTDDMGLTHTSTRKRGARRPSSARRRTGTAAAVQHSQPVSQATNYNPEGVK
jgi:hypothetical protein